MCRSTSMKVKLLVGLSLLFILISGCIQQPPIENHLESNDDGVQQLPMEEDIECNNDSDCVVAIRLDRCCDCPSVYPKKEVEDDPNLVVYESGKDYSAIRTVDCGRIMCTPCPPLPLGAVCSNNTCQEPRTWEEILRVCPDCYFQASRAAYKQDNLSKAIELCDLITSKDFHGIDDRENCLLNIARLMMENDTDKAVSFCSEHLDKRKGVCLREVAEEIAETDIEKALEICDCIVDDPSLGYSPKDNCYHNIAVEAREMNESRALEICEMMSERSEECKELILRYHEIYPTPSTPIQTPLPATPPTPKFEE